MANEKRIVSDILMDKGAVVKKLVADPMTAKERDALTGATELRNGRLIYVTDEFKMQYYSTETGNAGWKDVASSKCVAMKLKGTIGNSSSDVTSKIFPDDAEQGDTYIVSEDGEYTSSDKVTTKYAVKGDKLICTAEGDTTKSKSPVFTLDESGNGTLSADITIEANKTEYQVSNTLKSKDIVCSLYDANSGDTLGDLVCANIRVTADLIKVFFASDMTAGEKYHLVAKLG